MRNLLAACCFVLFGSLVSLPAQAQAPATVKLCNGGQPNCPVISSTNPLPVSGSFSASLGGFHWSASLPPMTNLGSSPVTQAITAGQTIVIQNIGTTNSAFCALGGTTSANATAIPPNSSYSLTSIAETSITCVTPTSTTTLNLQTGTGLWTNAGGGSTGGSGGAVTLASGADVVEGTITTAHGCLIAGYTVIGCIGKLDDDVLALTTVAGSPLAAQTGAVWIGNVDPHTAANWGIGATGAAAPANGVYGTGLASSSEPTAATTGNLTGSLFDLAGKAVTSPYANRENMVRGAVALSGTSAGTILAASGSASLKEYLTDLTCTRNDAGTTAVSITLNDTATTVIDIPNNGGGGGYSHTYAVPLAFAANTAATATSGTSITTIHCSASGFKGY